MYLPNGRYQEGASKVISFDQIVRYFKLLKLNSDPRTILFNAPVSDSIGTITLHEAGAFSEVQMFFMFQVIQQDMM